MLTTEVILGALLIFILRVVNNAIGTVRIVILTRQRRGLAAFMGFFESLIFAVTMAWVVTDLTNWLNLLAYCGGFSVGSYLGLLIETHFITSYMTATIITHERGHDIAVALREAGYGVTETVGEGRDGEVIMLRSVVTQREIPRLLHIVRCTHEEAFVAVEQARAIQRGFIRPSRPLSHG